MILSNNECSKCDGHASEDYLIDGESVCEECYFEEMEKQKVIDAIKGLSKYNRSAIEYDEAMSKGNEFVRLDEVIEIIETMLDN